MTLSTRISTSPRRVDPGNLESCVIQWKRVHRPAMGCESGRQDSNLRPLVPQTSPHFPMSAEFDLEWFCGELVGMTTRARVIGIRWNRVDIIADSGRVVASRPRFVSHEVRALPHQMGRPIPSASARPERTLGAGGCGGIVSAGTTLDKA